MKPRNPVVKTLIANPRRNAGKHKDKRENALRELIDAWVRDVQKLKKGELL
jgi:hypothetical protein